MLLRPLVLDLIRLSQSGDCGGKPTNPLLTLGLYLVSIHKMSPPKRGSTHPITALVHIYRPRKNERLSCPSWLTCSGRFPHIRGHPSAAGQAQDRESSLAKDRRSTTVLQACNLVPAGNTKLTFCRHLIQPLRLCLQFSQLRLLLL